MTTFTICRVADLAEQVERLRIAAARVQLEEARARRRLWTARDALEPDPEDEAAAVYWPREGRP